jgi:hypothetical protein
MIRIKLWMVPGLENKETPWEEKIDSIHDPIRRLL